MNENVHPGEVRSFAIVLVAGIWDGRLSGLNVLKFL